MDSTDLDIELFHEDDFRHAANLADLNLDLEADIIPELYQLNPAVSKEISNSCANGAYSSVAWSPSGRIARISRDRQSVDILCQMFDNKTSSWVLSRGRTLDVLFEQVTGLNWSNTHELAVFDHNGRVCIFTASAISFLQMTQARNGNQEIGDRSSQIIGSLWLNVQLPDRPKKQVFNMVRKGQYWRAQNVEGKAFPPYAVKAICTVNKTGVLSMMFARIDGQYRQTNYMLPIAPGSVFTHAAITQTKEGKLLVAIQSSYKQLSTFIVNMSFPLDLRQNPSTESVPTLEAIILENDLLDAAPYLVSSRTEMRNSMLMHLCWLPAPDLNYEQVQSQTIKQSSELIAVYAFCRTHHVGISIYDASLVKRWQFNEQDPSLHPAFGTVDDSSTDLPRVRGEPLGDVVLNTLISTIQLLEPGIVLALLQIDGRIQFRDARSFAIVDPDVNITAIACVADVSIDFETPINSIIARCLSPHGMASMNIDFLDDNSILSILGRQNRTNGLTHVSKYTVADVAGADTLTAMFTLYFARSVFTNHVSDDVLNAIHTSMSGASLLHVRRQLLTTLLAPKHYLPDSPEVEKLPNFLLVNKALSFQLMLYPRSNQHRVNPSELSRLWCWLAMNLKNSIAVVSLACDPRGSRGGNQGYGDPSFIDYLSSTTRWFFGVICFLLRTIKDMQDRKTHPHMFRGETVAQRLDDMRKDRNQELVALVLNHIWTRTFMVFFARLLKDMHDQHVNSPSDKPRKFGDVASAHMNQILRGCVSATGLSPGTIIALLDHENFADPEASEQGQFLRQVEMQVTGTIPEEYRGHVQRFAEGPLAQARQRGDVVIHKVQAYAYDISEVLLNMDDISFNRHLPKASMAHIKKVRRGAATPARGVYDVHKKRPIFAGLSRKLEPVADDNEFLKMQVRRCVRCGSLSDDIDGAYRYWPRMLLSIMSKCVCEGGWIVEPLGEGFNTGEVIGTLDDEEQTRQNIQIGNDKETIV